MDFGVQMGKWMDGCTIGGIGISPINGKIAHRTIRKAHGTHPSPLRRYPAITRWKTYRIGCPDFSTAIVFEFTSSWMESPVRKSKSQMRIGSVTVKVASLIKSHLKSIETIDSIIKIKNLNDISGFYLCVLAESFTHIRSRTL